MGDDTRKIIEEKKSEWESGSVAKSIGKFPEREGSFETTSGIGVERLYCPSDAPADEEYLNKAGFPGEYPFTRGVQPTMYRGRFWTMRQYAGFSSAKETNERFRYLAEQGQTGFSVAFDLPTQLGMDSDNPLAEGEVGKTGVPIDSARDVEALFDGLDFSKISVSMTINAPANVLLAMYIVAAERKGVAPEALNGTIQNDILKEYTARGMYIFPPKPSMRLITDVFKYCAARAPKWNTISISGYHIREAGSTAAQEVAFTLADGIAYAQSAIDAGLDVDQFAGRLSFFFNAHNNFFEEIAKYRAARRLWARIMKERFGAKKPASMMMRFHTQTAGSMLTAQQADNNVVRVALQALAAVLGGTQSLHTNSWDEALALPSEDAVRVALRTQQIIAHESGAADTIDPLAGSYFVESLTDEIERVSMEYIEKIDGMGGAVGAIEKGWMQKEIHDAAYRWQKDVESGRRVVVGVNKFQAKGEKKHILLRVSEQAEREQKASLEKLRAERDGAKAAATLKSLRKLAEAPDAPLFDAIVEAARADATLGEICGVFRDVFGVFRAP
jgi:methylmalonyl-CoA mutase N-terminal domain/subunit